MVAAFTWGDLVDLALSIFLIAVGLTLACAFVRVAGTFARVTKLVDRAEAEILPVLSKTGGTIDRVNQQLDKVDQMTDSAVDAVIAVDKAARTVSGAIRAPVQKLSALGAGIAHGASSLKRNRDLRGAVDAGKEAAERRERDLEDELRRFDEPEGP